MSELTPITRIEEYLDAIVEGGIPPLEDVTRIETFLEAIYNNQVCALTPVTRIEMFLGKISGQSIDLPEPVTRIELYLAAIAGEDVVLPDEPVTRIEMYLAEWAEGSNIPWETLSGAIVSFIAPKAHALKQVVVGINPVQSGSGDPSPDNIRPISGWTGAQIWVDDTHDTSAQADYNISWQTEAGTVYGGTLTVNEDGSAEIKLTHKNITYDGSNDEDWRIYSAPRMYINVPDFTSPATSVKADLMTNELTVLAKAQMGATDYAISASDTSSHQIIVKINNDVNTVARLKSWLSDNPLQVRYPLSTPVTFSLTAEQITALKGNNVMWADTGDITVTFRGTPVTEPDEQPLQALSLLLGGAYRNNQTQDDVSDEEALDILLGGADR